MKIYKVREFFVNSKLGPKFAGENFPVHLLDYLTEEQKAKLDEKDLNTNYDLFNYGLVFYSSEFDISEALPEETYDEMLCRMLEMNKTCCDPNCECKEND